MFYNVSTFRIIKESPIMVRQPEGSLRYDTKFNFKTVKLSDSVMVWCAFNGEKGRTGVYFLSQNITMKGVNI